MTSLLIWSPGLQSLARKRASSQQAGGGADRCVPSGARSAGPSPCDTANCRHHTRWWKALGTTHHVTSGSLHCTYNTVGQMNIPPTALSMGCKDKKRLRDNAKVLGGEHGRRGSGNPLAEPHSLPPQGLHLHKLLTFLQSGFLTQGNINGGGRVRETLFFF